MRFAILLTALTLTAHAQWTLQNSGTTASLRGIHALSPQMAWASGTGGTVLRTEDGGRTWQHCTTPPNAEKLDFRGVQAIDAATAIVMSSGKGDLSRLYKTNDSCKTWQLIATNRDPDGFWDALILESPQLGWVLGDPVNGHFMVMTLSVSPTGATLRNDCEFPEDHAQGSPGGDCSGTLKADPATAGAFAASNSSFFVMRHAAQTQFGPPLPPGATPHLSWINLQFFVTGGTSGAKWCERKGFSGGDVIPQLSWQCQPIPVGTSTEGSGAFSIFFNEQHAGVIVGGDYQHPDASANTAVYGHADFQKGTPTTWQPVQTPPHGYRSAVAYDSTAKTWITVGPNGTDISTDDGHNWSALKPGTNDPADADQHWNALSLPFVVGSKGRIGLLQADRLKPPPPSH